MNQQAIGQERGRKAGAGIVAKQFLADMAGAFQEARLLFPTAANLDFPGEIRAFDAERLADQPDLGRFPELKGHIDLLRGEREGFRKQTHLDETATAFRYSWGFFLSRRLSSRHLARYDLMPVRQACTNIFFPQGADGVTIADNRDDVPCPAYVTTIPAHRPAHLLQQEPLHWQQGAVSAAVLMDDEPACLFPGNPFEYNLLPPEVLDDINDLMEFGVRYREFYGPGNQIWVDRQLNAVAVEKTNCLVAFRRPTVNGAVAVTACAYLDETLHAHQMACTRRAMQIKGDTAETSVDLNYHLGSRRRYRRLVELTNREAARPGGATLWGALAVVADHAVPFPDRICLAGEKTFPDKEPNANWSLTQHAAVVTGRSRRLLYRSLQDLKHPRPVYEYIPKLLLGAGVSMRPEWQADIAASRCEPAR